MMKVSAFFLACCTLLSFVAMAESSREFTLHYDVKIPAQNTGSIEVFVPLAQSDENQEVLSYVIESSAGVGRTATESLYKNRFWTLRFDASQKEESVRITYQIRRHLFKNTELTKAGADYQKNEKKEFALFLKANRRVPIDGTPVDGIVSELKVDSSTPLKYARSAYDYVVDNMDYKKVGTGWGNGDTYWACSEKYGNCTDFHALFTSLVRARGIPARFEIGFPIPTDKNAGTLGGYHCWLSFYLPNAGWVPIDASEAKKHPENRELFFGTHPADRVAFTVGRDLELGQASGPLNYFVFPLVETEGRPVDDVETLVRYTGLKSVETRLNP